MDEYNGNAYTGDQARIGPCPIQASVCPADAGACFINAGGCVTNVDACGIDLSGCVTNSSACGVNAGTVKTTGAIRMIRLIVIKNGYPRKSILANSNTILIGTNPYDDSLFQLQYRRDLLHV